MAGVRISALNPVTTALLTDFLPVVQTGITQRETLQQILTLFDANIQLASPSQVTGFGTAALKAASDNTQPDVASIAGATVVNDVAAFNDILGTIKDSGVALSNLALLTGAVFSGTVTLNGIQMNSNDAATIGYVNATATGLTIVAAVFAATTVNLTATYNNGSSGVGATLTNSGTQIAFATDGISPPINSRILVKNQTARADNGIYSLTTVGTGSTNWVLTRTTDYDTAAQIKPGTLVLVQNGTIFELTSWLETLTVTTVGTDPISFTQFSTSPTSLGQAAFKSVSDNTQPSVASVDGTTIANDFVSFNDTTGTVKDSGFAATSFLQVANNLGDVASPSIAALNLFVTRIVTTTANIPTTDYGKTIICTGAVSYGVALIGHSSGKYVQISSQTTSFALVTIGAVSGTIAGQASIVLGSGDSILLYDDGTNFWVIQSWMQPASFYVYTSAAQTIIPNTITKVSYNTKLYDVGSFFDNVTFFRYAPLLPGKYQFYNSLLYGAPSSNTLVAAYIDKNGTRFSAANLPIAASFANTSVMTSLNTFMNGSSDYVEGETQQLSTSNFVLQSNQIATYMQGYRISLF